MVTGWPRRTECARAGCGHSSDVHTLDTDRLLVNVTDSSLHFPCTECECPTMVRSAQNYAALIAGLS